MDKTITGRLTGAAFAPAAESTTVELLLTEILYKLQQANRLSEEAKREMESRFPLVRGQKDPPVGAVRAND